MTVFPDVVIPRARHLSTPARVEVAQAVVATHRANAPVVTGAYRDGAAVQKTGDDVSVINRDPAAVYKEYGTADTPVHATMTNAARRYGRYTGWSPR